jgi:hypothetical protein
MKGEQGSQPLPNKREAEASLSNRSFKGGFDCISILIVKPAGSGFHFFERSVRHDLFGCRVNQNLSGLSYGANEWISKKYRYPPHFGLNIELWTASQKPIRQIVRQEEARRSLSFKRSDRRDYIGDHDGLIIALLIRAYELRK